MILTIKISGSITTYELTTTTDKQRLIVIRKYKQEHYALA